LTSERGGERGMSGISLGRSGTIDGRLRGRHSSSPLCIGAPMNVEEAARSHALARDRYHEIFRAHFDQRVQPLPDDRFWRLQPIFVEEVRTFRFVMKRSDGVARAADEFFRKPYAGHFSDRNGRAFPRYSLDEAMQFAKAW